jgi:hypothetical protein
VGYAYQVRISRFVDDALNFVDYLVSVLHSCDDDLPVSVRVACLHLVLDTVPGVAGVGVCSGRVV